MGQVSQPHREKGLYPLVRHCFERPCSRLDATAHRPGTQPHRAPLLHANCAFSPYFAFSHARLSDNNSLLTNRPLDDRGDLAVGGLHHLGHLGRHHLYKGAGVHARDEYITL